jgi:Arc/MetJ family transcription regulator
MRTNIVLNDDLMQEAMHFTSAKSKRALIEEALRTFVEVKAAERQRETYQERLQRLDAKLRNLRLRQSPAEILRADRDRQ